MQSGHLLEAHSETELSHLTSLPPLPMIPASYSVSLSSPCLFALTWALNCQPVK